MVSLLTSDALERKDRFDWFCETVSSDVMPVSLNTRHADDFQASLMSLDLGVAQLSSLVCSPVASRRTLAHVRRGDPENLQLALITQGAFRISQRGNESVVAGGFVLTDTSRPSEGSCTGGQVGTLVVQVPRQALALGSDRVDRLLAQGLAADAGSGAILADFLTSLVARGPHCRPEELHAMGAVTLDLATAFLARQLGDPGQAPAGARALEALKRVYRFIEHNLGDSDLTPRMIADRHSMSLRRLHALFSDQPLTLAACIRQRRLERAHADLACAELNGLPVQAIAARWGFSSATGFSRAFREAYGITPTEHRALALTAPQHSERRNPAVNGHPHAPLEPGHVPTAITGPTHPPDTDRAADPDVRVIGC
ncbi:helix-turn-helix domain-containing protein [Streptomyces sp. NPDC056367]|uniref:AraC-like ligand-binding domain-containing protein n=1 Tax=Streptomyces sp. NPDC056367 TaxID=3345797 RepID=UPI0035DAB167